MLDVNCAQAAVSFYSQRSPVVRGHVIHVQFSNHDQLVPDDASQHVRLLVSLDVQQATVTSLYRRLTGLSRLHLSLYDTVTSQLAPRLIVIYTLFTQETPRYTKRQIVLVMNKNF